MYLCSMKKIMSFLLVLSFSCPLFSQVSGGGEEERPMEVSTSYSMVYDRDLPVLLDLPNVFQPQGEQSASCLKDWHVGVDVTTFFRDAEFFLPYTKGYTATGFFLNPYVRRSIGSNAQVTMGVHLAGVAGYEGIRKWQPLVRLEYEPHRNWRLVMGSLYGTLSHGLLEPMFDRERYIYDHQEEGIQVLGNLSFGPCRLKTDTWIHWEELLEPWQPTQERFTLGSNNDIRLLALPLGEGNGELNVRVPLSFLGCHRGGQFTALDTCIQTLFNENVGLRLSWTEQGHDMLDIDVPFFFYQDMSPTKLMAYPNGWGIWPQVSLNEVLPQWKRSSRWRGAWRLQLQAGYWYGHQFIAPRGSYLFQSISWHNPDFATPEREMLTAKIALANAYNKLTMGLDAEFYYGLREKGLDMAVGLYMRYCL